MIVGRIIGWIFLLIAVAILGWDIVTMVMESRFGFIKGGDLWALIDRDSLLLTQPAVERYLHPYLWQYFLQPILEAPAFVPPLVLALLFLWIFRRRKKR